MLILRISLNVSNCLELCEFGEITMMLTELLVQLQLVMFLLIIS